MPSVATIDGSRRIRIRNALKKPVATPTPRRASEPVTRPKPDVVGVSVNDATTTHSVMSAATETSKPPTSSATAWPIETMISGSAARSSALRFSLLRNADECALAYAPSAMISVVNSTSGSQPRVTPALLRPRGRAT